MSYDWGGGTILNGQGPYRFLDTITVQPQSANPRVWRYVYALEAGGWYWRRDAHLRKVIRPDASEWAFNLDPLVKGCYGVTSDGSLSFPCPNKSFDSSITSPSGATATYSFVFGSHKRYIPSGGFHDHRYDFQTGHYLAPTRKRVTGPNVDLTWTYTYAPGHNRADNLTPWQWVNTTITNPDQTKTRYTVNNIYRDRLEGRVDKVETFDSAGTVLREEMYEYAGPVQGPYPAKVGASLLAHVGAAGLETYIPLLRRTVLQQSDTYTHHVDGYDIFARTIMASQHSANFAKTTTTAYYDNPTKWIYGKLQRTTIGGVETQRIEYDTQGLPWRTYRFGKLQQTLTYNTDGTLATAADGRGNVTTFSSWKRGIPQLIRHPATPEAPAGATESAIVNDNGWITSVTDENDYATGYGYDAMGRMASIVHPSGSGESYHNTLMNFRALTDADWKPPGVASGQWRLYEETGNRVTIAYMDALWRPVLKHEYDATNVGPTLRAVKTGYDTNGRVSFQSYPSSDMIPGASGIRTFYDALDRVTRVEQDSELGVLATTTEYLSGLRTRVTNPRGYQTTTSFMAWDQPGYDLPILSEQPEGKVIEIARHPQFGWPQQLKQRNTADTLQQSRQYVYDIHGQLCKTIEPESGATVMDYDAAGNLSWSATGLTGAMYTGLNDCSQAAAGGSGRVSHRAYDARNRLTNLAFPDGRGDQVWTYKPDSLPASVTVYNDGNGLAPVVTAYEYNRRRLLTGESLSQPGWYTWGLGYAYDAYGSLRWQSYPTGLVLDYAPNPLGQATQVRDNSSKSYASNAQYHPNGALKQFTYGNGIVHTMTQNTRQLPVRVTATGNAMDYDYAYDPNGNVERIYDYVTGTPTPRHRWMGYDGLDRLTSTASAVFGGTDNTHRFTYDALDNMTSWKLAGVKDYADYVYEASTHRLTNIRNTAGATVIGLGYDPQGNLQNKNGQAYDFDYGNRLRGVTGKEYYRYDGMGRRVMASEPATNSILSQYSQSGQVVYQENHRGPQAVATEHLYLGGSLIASRDNIWGVSQTVKYQHTDALGSPVAVSNEAGQVIERNDYEPYGAIIGKPTFSGIGYTGHIMDGVTGLTYMQQRYYDQSIGRFLSVDPVMANSGTGINFNRYRYAANNPYRFIDPDGRQELARNANGKWELLGVEFKMPEFLSRMVSGEPAESADRQRMQRFVSAAFKAEIDAEIRTSPQQALDAMDAALTASIIYPGSAGMRTLAQARRVNELREMLWLANVGKGNFGIGNASLREVMAMGRAWVGNGYRVSSNGKAWLSRDGFRQFRLPSNKNSKYAPTGVQANFESRSSARGGWENNAHLNVEIKP